MAQFKIIESDPYLGPFSNFFYDIQQHSLSIEGRLTKGKYSLAEVAKRHQTFGLHRTGKEWIIREWAPNASAVYLIGTFSDWRVQDEYALAPIGQGEWELRLPADALHHQDLYRLHIAWPGGCGERMPAYLRRAVQDHHTKIFSAQVWQPERPYSWKTKNFTPRDEPLLIYESHVGMALEEGRVGTYLEFRDQILPRIIDAGYNTIQLMAIQEHPYYGSFGYQISNFFAPSSRFGTPDELKSLIDAAHAAGLRVLLDIVHSHAVKNEVEGLSRFDGTYNLYFHSGARGEHPVWDSRLFDYGKDEVLLFLLSNVRYWIEEFHFDGFRFDGVTSMVYFNHGLGDPFTTYERYFQNAVDRDALSYLVLANKLAHEMGQIVTIAEDVSGLPGLAAPIEDGGFGFDYRLTMGIPDFWTKTLKEKQDHEWHVEGMLFELTNRRKDEKTINYAECHDQALVGDQTIFFRLMQDLVYHNMRLEQHDYAVDRGLALHRLIRFITLTTAGHGYLNFMGNEFGHPEWIDFPRPGNNWSFHHARRLWSLRDNPELQYHRLAQFDKEMIAFVREYKIFNDPHAALLCSHVENQVIGFCRASLLFIFNFNSTQSFPDYEVEAPAGEYEIIFDSDAHHFAGHGRIDWGPRIHTYPLHRDGRETHCFRVYLPTRTAVVLRRV